LSTQSKTGLEWATHLYAGALYANHRDWLGSVRLRAGINGTGGTGGDDMDVAYTPYAEPYAKFQTQHNLNFTGDFADLFELALWDRLIESLISAPALGGCRPIRLTQVGTRMLM
jgi:hypothetical protein